MAGFVSGCQAPSSLMFCDILQENPRAPHMDSYHLSLWPESQHSMLTFYLFNQLCSLKFRC